MIVLWLGQSLGATGSRTRIYLQCKNWLFGAHVIWRDTLLSLDAEGRDLVLPQVDIANFVDSSWEALSFLRSG